MMDTVAMIDLVVSAASPAAVVRAATRLPAVRETLDVRGSVVTLQTFDGPRARVAAAPPSRLGAVLVHATAAAGHWRGLQRVAASRAMQLTSEGLLGPDANGLDVADPDALYGALDLQPVPAEQRDGTDELDLARDGRLPRCAGVADLRGDLHDHTDWSGDGRMTMRDLIDAAMARSWEYLAITDHAEDLRINGLDRATMLRQRDELRALQRRHDDVAVLHGAELNIGPDGSVDYDPDFVAGYDWTVASVHSLFDLDVAEQTARVVTAIRNPGVHAIGHLTGRRIGRRAGIRIDVDAVLDACATTGTALEVNCHLDRLDAPAEVLREAAARGVFVVISTDAHRLGDLDNHRWGVRLARRGRVPAELVANTWPVERFVEWIGTR
jgi:DNA polymerase (family 10)